MSAEHNLTRFLWASFIGRKCVLSRATITLLLERQVEAHILNFIHIYYTGMKAEILDRHLDTTQRKQLVDRSH